jgi:catechol 2,3-dioxygenase-like lactoylglutathione lyase family enzyme
MICKHLNIATTEVVADTEFFEQFFGFEVRHRGGKNGDGISVLSNDDDFVLAIMKGAPDIAYPGTFHVGFYVDSPEEVEAKHAELEAGGRKPGKVQHLQRGGNVTQFYVKAPGDYDVEVSTPPDEIVGERPLAESHSQT